MVTVATPAIGPRGALPLSNSADSSRVIRADMGRDRQGAAVDIDLEHHLLRRSEAAEHACVVQAIAAEHEQRAIRPEARPGRRRHRSMPAARS